MLDIQIGRKYCQLFCIQSDPFWTRTQTARLMKDSLRFNVRQVQLETESYQAARSTLDLYCQGIPKDSMKIKRGKRFWLLQANPHYTLTKDKKGTTKTAFVKDLPPFFGSQE